ncbi:MAG: preprotein translocase subunit SecG [Patescibacteria group bacterium]|jgi:preprotein translocase subunit SecG
MNWELTIQIAEIVVVALLVVTILLQQKGSGLGAVFGGGNDIYATKRGAEKFIFISSIALSVIFLGLSLASFLIQK